jgi:ABC-type branched-subunit amino acid transport system substrate-binding protein
MIAPSTSSDSFSNESNFYRIVSPDKTQSCVGLDFIVNHLIPNLEHVPNQQFKIAIFQDKLDTYSHDLASDLEAEKTGNISCASYSPSLPTSNLVTFPENYTRGQQPQDFQNSVDEALQQQTDIVFFSGYSDDLQNFETFLSHEQEAHHYQKQILIVGGDGLYQIPGEANTYTTPTYVTIYTPPLTGESSDLERYFVTQYQKEFDSSNTKGIPSGTLFTPHALEMFDAINAFTIAIQDAKSRPSQDDFDQSLQNNVDFDGLTGTVQFNGNQTANQTRGISDPLNKTIYVMCTNKGTATTEAAIYSPGPTPTIKSYLKGQDLLNCNALQ